VGRTPFPSEGFAVEHLDDDLNVWMCGSCGGARCWRAARAVGGGERASERGCGSAGGGAVQLCIFVTFCHCE
jgi:hypothetical protein